MTWWRRWRLKRLDKAIMAEHLRLVGLNASLAEAQEFKNRSAQLLATNYLTVEIQDSEARISYLERKARQYK